MILRTAIFFTTLAALFGVMWVAAQVHRAEPSWRPVLDANGNHAGQ